jgi:predicted transcriptional regulator
MSVFHRMLNGSSDCEDLLACVFRLNELEVRAYFALLEHPETRMDELAEALDRDRSTVHRAVQTLVDLQLAERRAEGLDGGGYCYTYEAASPAAVRERIEERLDAFQEAVEERLARFEEDAAREGAAPARENA